MINGIWLLIGLSSHHHFLVVSTAIPIVLLRLYLVTNRMAGWYGDPQLSHQNQMLTSNSNRSHQIQIAHIKFKSLTANSNRSQQITNHLQQITNRSQQIQIAHSKFKSPTANSNRSQQIKVAHSKFKLLTANYIPLGVFGYLQPAVQLV